MDHGEVDSPYVGHEWEWNSWETHDINTDVPGPEQHDRYEGPHGLKPNVSKKLHCSAMHV